MNDKYVWYACYGSNLNKERFLCYIQGGVCHYNGKYFSGCIDKSMPLMDKPITIPHKLYFANNSGSWEGCGVAFIDPRRDSLEVTLGRMYLITAEQFAEVREQEGNNRNWYGELLELGEADGYKIKTFTNAGIRPTNVPSGKYLRAMVDGLKETYPQIDDAVIQDYYLDPLGDSLYRVG
jgi:hypothetical protein